MSTFDLMCAFAISLNDSLQWGKKKELKNPITAMQKWSCGDCPDVRNR